MSFTAAAQEILEADSADTQAVSAAAASPRFPPRNHDDLVQAREYEELLDSYGNEAHVSSARLPSFLPSFLSPFLPPSIPFFLPLIHARIVCC